jgi:tRNA splicing ligase
MKNALAVLALLLTMSCIADDRPIAGDDLLQELKEYCQDIAHEDEVSEEDMEDFLLACVNEQLELEGYQPIKRLPE